MSSLLNALQSIDPVAFAIGSLEVRWYGLAYLAGFVAAAWLLYRFARRWDVRIAVDDVYIVLLYAIVGVMVGGRLGYVLFYGFEYYLANPAKILATWDGGMSFHGGFIGILLGGVLAARHIGISWFTLADLGAIGAPIGFGLGRLSNFINGELWGKISDVPWAVVFQGAGPMPRHPSQLYEAILEGIVLTAVMVLLARQTPPRPRGELFGWMTMLYGVFRIVVEFFREPDAALGYLAGGWLTMGMVLSVPLVVAGIIIVIWANRRNLSQAQVSRYTLALEAEASKKAGVSQRSKAAAHTKSTGRTGSSSRKPGRSGKQSQRRR